MDFLQLFTSSSGSASFSCATMVTDALETWSVVLLRFRENWCIRNNGLTAKNRTWSSMGWPHHSRSRTRAFSAAAIYSEVGNGAATLFWTDRWLHGQSIADLAPRLFATISVRRRKKRTVQEALTNQAWIFDIQGALTVGVLIEYLHLWDILFDFQLHPDSEDKHIWRFSADGQYSAKLAYEGFFLGSTRFGPWEKVWNTWAPPKCRFFMWLVAHKRCWTSDRLARRGLPHPTRCLMCDQATETIDHLLVHCIFAREYWYRFLSQSAFSLSPLYP